MSICFLGDWLPKKSREKVGRELELVDRVANLECAFADGDVDSAKAYTSILPRSCLEHVSAGGFAALSVANNHVNDSVNFRETYDELIRRFPDIQFFGTISKPYATIKQLNNRVFVIGCLEPCRSRGDYIFKQEDVAALIRDLRSSQSQSSMIFVCPHWGKEGEYTRYPAPWQLRLAREWIDAGADGVFGSHSHVPQGREYYNGKPIYYSLGNYDFDHPESKLYEGTDDRLIVEVEVDSGVRIRERFNTEQAKESVEKASRELEGWNTLKWARKVGPFNLKKNTASWKLRLKKNFIKTLPKYLVWQVLPQTLLFRIASLWR